MRLTKWAVKISDGRYLMSVDDDGHTTIPLFASPEEAAEAADRADLESCTYEPVTLG